jgi:hypothetical protein
MEVEYSTQKFGPNLSFQTVMGNFFITYSPDYVQYLFWNVFKCWGTNECKVKSEISDEEIALFFDQLIDLVAAAYIVHEANRVSQTGQEGNGHE